MLRGRSRALAGPVFATADKITLAHSDLMGGGAKGPDTMCPRAEENATQRNYIL